MVCDHVAAGLGGLESFASMLLPIKRTNVAPDGSDVRVLLGLAGGGMAHFELAPGETSRAVAHKTVEEIWFFLGGRGEMWREQADAHQIIEVLPGTCITIPLGTRFQFRSTGEAPLSAVAVTIPPWPGEDEAVVVEGPWLPTAPREGRL
jgi:mannose-6-phosphate isomerase-like protein (cupin superfamily)